MLGHDLHHAVLAQLGVIDGHHLGPGALGDQLQGMAHGPGQRGQGVLLLVHVAPVLPPRGVRGPELLQASIDARHGHVGRRIQEEVELPWSHLGGPGGQPQPLLKAEQTTEPGQVELGINRRIHQGTAGQQHQVRGEPAGHEPLHPGDEGEVAAPGEHHLEPLARGVGGAQARLHGRGLVGHEGAGCSPGGNQRRAAGLADGELALEPLHQLHRRGGLARAVDADDRRAPHAAIVPA